jgi:hypothetical protein
MRFIGVATVSAAAIALGTSSAAASTVVLDPGGVGVSAYGGWAAWSRADATTKEFALVLRSPGGTISLAPVPESPTVFDVELGPSGSGVAAVYSVCTGGACHIDELPLGVAGASERELEIPGGGSLHEPAIWRNRIAFLRLNPRGGSADPTDPGRRPDLLFEWQIGSHNLQSVRLPTTAGSSEIPAGLTGAITGLAFNGKQLAYATSTLAGTFGLTSLWFQQLGHGPVLIDQRTSGAAALCPASFLSPTLAGGWLYAYLHACDPSAQVGIERLTRYRRGEVQRAKYTFIRAADDEIDSVAVDAGGVDWGDGGLRRLTSVAWRTIAPPVPENFCGRRDAFC